MNDEWLFYRGDVINFEVPENVSLPIYVIGDSHVRILVEAAPYIFKSSQVDIEDVFLSKTAYAIGGEKYLNDAINNIPEGSNVLLSFGEIDCRHYIPVRAIQNNTSISEETVKVFERFSQNTLRVLKDMFKVSVMGAYVCPDDHNHENNFSHIRMAKSYLNALIKGYCSQWGMCYIPLFDFVNENRYDTFQFEISSYFNDSSHLGPVMIPEILKAMSKHE